MGEFSPSGDFGRPSFADEIDFTPASSWQPITINVGPAFAVGSKSGGAVAQKVNAWQAYQDRRDQRIAELQAPGGATEENASVCIGGLGGARPTTATGTRSVVRNSGDDKKKKPTDPKPQQRITWEELSRKNKKVKVASEDDPDVFMWTNVAQQSRIRTHENAILEVNWCKDVGKGGGP